MTAPVAAPASIPSPSSGTLELGPLSLNAYGLMIALGVVAAIWLLGRRFEQKGIGTREDATTIGLWAVAAGIVGARLYHVATDWERFDGNYGDIVKIWEGGLGIPGGLLAGIPVGIWVAHRRGLPMGEVANCAAPAIALAQAIGRWGNWFNQELFGRPTDLPWALEIDEDHLPPGYAPGTTFHPTFLYESLWNFALCGVLLWIDRRFNPAPGRLHGDVRRRLRHRAVLGRVVADRHRRSSRRAALEPVGRARGHRRRAHLPGAHEGSRAPVAESNRCRRPGTGTRLT